MAWFARSLANTFIPDQDGDEDAATTTAVATTTGVKKMESGEASEIMSPRGVKEDLSEITKTLTRQLWGVASFLAPPPDSNPPSSLPARSDPYGSDNEVDEDTSDLPGIEGIRSDFAELGGRFRNRISSLSSNRAVSEISKIATSFLPFGAEEEEDGEEDWISSGSEAIGVTEEVLAFARNISMHPETWLDFPLLPEEEDSDDFDMSNAQQEHALAVEHLAPRLAALRIELCPRHMSEGCFWKIYFVLLHPRLNKDDAERLSTPQIVEARGMLLQKLQNQTKSESYNRKDSGTSSPVSGEQIIPTGFQESSVLKKMLFEEPARSISTDSETEKHSIITTEIKIVDKSVIKEEMPIQGTSSSTSSDTSKIPIQRFEDDGDDWLEDEGTEMDGSNVTHIPIGDEEDVSFSDLEDDDDKATPAPATSQKERKKIPDSNSKAKASKDWVELGKGSSKLPIKDEKNISSENESNEWLDVEDIDLV